MHAKRIPPPKPTRQDTTQRRISYGWLIAGIVILLITNNRQVIDSMGIPLARLSNTVGEVCLVVGIFRSLRKRKAS